MKTLLILPVAALVIGFSACSKQELPAPAAQKATVTAQSGPSFLINGAKPPTPVTNSNKPPVESK